MSTNTEVEESESTPIVVGSIGAPYGVRGWVKINSFTQPSENLFAYPWLLERSGVWQAVQLDEFRDHAGGFVAKLATVEDRDQAALLTNCKIGEERGELPDLSEDEFYWEDIIGLHVFNQDNVELGTVAEIFATGANDVLVVRGHGAQKSEHLIPLVFDKFVVKVDLEAHRLDVYWDLES
jgi:16S rRNA processing protein RimM